MSHKMAIGRTEFGKTRTMKVLANGIVAKHEKVLAYDILGSKWPDGVQVVTDREEFLHIYWSETEYTAVFIDESAETVARWDDEMEKTATRGRHAGHQNFYIVQKATMMSDKARSQCTGIYLFNCTGSDVELLYKEYGKKLKDENDPYRVIFDATNFEPGVFLYFTVTQPPIKYKLNFEKNIIERA